MCILIDEQGKIYTNKGIINQLLSPVKIGNFYIPDYSTKFIKDELNEANISQLFNFIPTEMHISCQKMGLIPTKASIFKKQRGEIPQVRSEASQTPHINSGNEMHFFFDGSYLIYFNIEGQHFSLVVQKGDWLFIPADIEHWIKETEDNYLVIVSYHSEPFEVFHSKVKYTDTKSHAYI